MPDSIFNFGGKSSYFLLDNERLLIYLFIKIYYIKNQYYN